MNHTIGQRATLRRIRRRTLTTAGKFWLPYAFVVILLFAYVVVS